MFAIPAGMFLGAPVSTAQWWLWNQVPVTLGNIVAGALFTGIALWLTYARRPAQAVRESEAPADAVLAKAG
jgi:formate/nitrite transporter FocA (FNT family)